MACCCKSGGKSNKSSVSCLGRCDLPKHKCHKKGKASPIPRSMGWHYTAKDSPEHQLRCGWRPGHISCSVLKKIEHHNCSKQSCEPCPSPCRPRPYSKPCFMHCPTSPVCPGPSTCLPSDQPLIRIVRHAGQYTICTKPSSMNNSPSGQNPLKYFIDDDDDGGTNPQTKYSVEAKFNDSQFDYTCSTGSFVIDFSPPPGGCKKSCK